MRSKTNRRRGTQQKVPSEYHIPQCLIAKPYDFNLRFQLEPTVVATSLYTLVLTPAQIIRCCLDQISNSSVRVIPLTAAGGAIAITPASTTALWSFVKVKSAHIWGITGGEAFVSHSISSTSYVPATPKVNSQSSGSSSKPYAVITYPNSKGMAFASNFANSVMEFTFNGPETLGSAIDPSIILDIHCVLFD